MRILKVMSLAFAFLHAAVAAKTAGCGKTSTMKSGTYTAQVNNKQREYIVKLPETYDSNRPYSLIFTFHPLTGNMRQIASASMGLQPFYGLEALANNSAIFVSPNGLNGTGTGLASFTGWGNEGGEDIEFVRAMIKVLDAELCIEDRLRFSTGFSYGGAMSYSIACTLAAQFRAVSVLSSGPISGCEGGNDPVAYYHQHGVADDVLSITMGRQMRDRFIKNNGCTAVTPEPLPNGQTATRIDYKGCKEGFPVTYVVHSGGHDPAVKNPGDAGPFAPRNTWEFFSQFM